MNKNRTFKAYAVKMRENMKKLSKEKMGKKLTTEESKYEKAFTKH